MQNTIRWALCVAMAATGTAAFAEAGDTTAAAQTYEELAPVARALNCYHDATAVCTDGETQGAASGEPAQDEPVVEHSGYGGDGLPSRE